MSSLVTKIGKQVNQMTKSQKKVANYLLFNMDKLLFFTADELAKAANVSTATVVRFARELDFEGYTDMQKAARLRFHDREEEPEDLPQSSPEEDSSEYLLEKSFRQDIQNLKRTFQDLSREDLVELVEIIQHCSVTGREWAMRYYTALLRRSLSLPNVMDFVASGEDVEVIAEKLLQAAR